MASSDDARRIFLGILSDAAGGFIMPDAEVMEAGARAVGIALDSAMRLQLEKDCAIVCRYCQRAPALGAARLVEGTHGRLLWRHSIVRARGRHGYVTCLANPMRHAWQMAHPEESADGA